MGETCLSSATGKNNVFRTLLEHMMNEFIKYEAIYDTQNIYLFAVALHSRAMFEQNTNKRVCLEFQASSSSQL